MLKQELHKQFGMRIELEPFPKMNHEEPDDSVCSWLDLLIPCEFSLFSKHKMFNIQYIIYENILIYSSATLQAHLGTFAMF